jgi:PleD family two-component response regulator
MTSEEMQPISTVPTVDVLIVDDRPENLLALEQLLDGPEINLVRANSGFEALATLIERDFALVLLDVQMPGMDGFEVAELMRGRVRTRNVPIIFLTAINTEQRYVFKGYEMGAVDYLFKPLDPYILKCKVDAFTNLYRQGRIIAAQLREIEEKNQALERQLAEIKHLRGLLPICAGCKRIRDDQGYWEELETYLINHTDVEFTHGFCPECLKKYYPDMF